MKRIITLLVIVTLLGMPFMDFVFAGWELDDTVAPLYETGFALADTVADGNYLQPSSWSITPATGVADKYVNVVADENSKTTGDPYFRMYNNFVPTGTLTAKKTFQIPENSKGLLRIKFDYRAAHGNSNEWISLMNGDTLGIVLTSSYFNATNLNPIVIDGESQAPYKSGTSDANYFAIRSIIGPSKVGVISNSFPIFSASTNWVNIDMAVNTSEEKIPVTLVNGTQVTIGKGVFVVSYTVGANTYYKKGIIGNDLKTFDNIRIVTPDVKYNGQATQLRVDNFSIKFTPLVYIENIFSNQTVVKNGETLVSNQAEFAGNLAFESTLSNQSRTDKEATVLALLYRDGYMVDGAFAYSESVPHYLPGQQAIYVTKNFTMPIAPKEVFGDMSIKVLTVNDFVNMAALTESVSIPVKTEGSINFQGITQTPAIDLSTNFLTYQNITKPNAIVTFAVIKEGANPTKDMLGNKITDVFYYINQTKANQNGEYEFKIKFSGIDTNYKLLINSGDNAQVYDLHFENQRAHNIINEFSEIKTLDALKPKLDTFLEEVNFSDTLYNHNREEIKSSDLFYQIVLKKHLADPINSSVQAVETAKLATLIFVLSKVENLSNFSATIKENFYGINLANMYCYDLYNNAALVDQAIKDSTVNHFINVAYANKAVLNEIPIFLDYIGDSLLLTVCENTVGRAAGNAVITGMHKKLYQSDNVFSTAYDIFNNSLSAEKKITVAENIMGNGYESFDLLKDKFVLEVNNANKPSDNNNNNSGSQGSTRRGGGSNNFTVPQATPLPDLIPAAYQIPKAGNPAEFNDLQDFSWAVKSIDMLSSRGIISGDGNGRFNPNNSVTREELVKMIIKILGIETVYVGSNFEDVPYDTWYYEYISAAYTHGIINGIDSNRFGVGMPTTREDICAVLTRAIEKYGVVIPEPDGILFSDDKAISDYAKRGVYILKTMGAVNGLSDGTFSPKTNATRAETAKILGTVIDYILSH